MANNNPHRTRTNITWIFTILLGFVLGFLIKRVHVGLLIGLVLGLIGSSMMRRR